MKLYRSGLCRQNTLALWSPPAVTATDASLWTDTTRQRMKKIPHKLIFTHDREKTHPDNKACLTIHLNFMDKPWQTFMNKNPHVCFYDDWKLEMTWGWAHDDEFYMFGWTFYLTQSVPFWKMKAEQIEVIWCIWHSKRKISKLCSILHLLQVSANHNTETNVKVNN